MCVQQTECEHAKPPVVFLCMKFSLRFLLSLSLPSSVRPSVPPSLPLPLSHPKTESQVAQAGLGGYVAKDNLEPLILLLPPLECCDYRCMPSPPVYTGDPTQSLLHLAKHSANWALFLDLSFWPGTAKWVFKPQHWRENVGDTSSSYYLSASYDSSGGSVFGESYAQGMPPFQSFALTDRMLGTDLCPPSWFGPGDIKTWFLRIWPDLQIAFIEIIELKMGPWGWS